MQQRRALRLLRCSAPATRCCCACAVTARAPLVFISRRYQPRLLAQRALSAESTTLMCSVRRASDLLLGLAPDTRCCGACAVIADAPLVFISCRRQLRLFFSAPLWLCCSDVQQLRASCLRRCWAPTTRCYCACALIARASHFVMAVYLSSFSGSAAPPRYCSDMQQRSALSLLLYSAPATRCCGACAVTARAPLVFINHKLSISAPSSSSARLIG
jgi:hypothetical protein